MICESRNYLVYGLTFSRERGWRFLPVPKGQVRLVRVVKLGGWRRWKTRGGREGRGGGEGGEMMEVVEVVVVVVKGGGGAVAVAGIGDGDGGESLGEDGLGEEGLVVLDEVLANFFFYDERSEEHEHEERSDE